MATTHAGGRVGRLANRTALITGGSRGIGLAIAQLFAREGANVCVTATSRASMESAAKLVADGGGHVETRVLDVADRAGCFEVAASTAEALGPIDILVNNAGRYIPRPFLDYSAEEFDEVLQVDLYGPFHMLQAVLPSMRERGSGKVINIASTAGKWASRHQAAYNAAKHGLVGLTRCIALEFAPDGVTVNAICPGIVETEMWEQYKEAHSEISQVSPEDIATGLLARIAAGRFLKAEEVAHLALYLASAESGGMTGQSILLDGGMLFV